MRVRAFAYVPVALLLGLLAPCETAGQANVTGTIAGAVKDTGGGVLPGVSVEATSTALIERVRTVTTDGRGEYKIINLPPGTYTVTFALGGFSSLRREGIELSGGTTAAVSAELRVGTLEESITVSGQSPVVDVQSTTQNRTVSRAAIESLPVGRQLVTYLTLVPGITIVGSGAGTNVGADVGGSAGDKSFRASVHGSNSRETAHEFNGMRMGNMFGTGGGSNGPWVPNTAMVEEIVVETAGHSAEAEVSGVHHNMIPKQGGNVFSGYLYGNFTNSNFQTNNLTEDLIARGAPTTDVVDLLWDFNPAAGGPIKRDAIWIYASYRYFGSDNVPSGSYFAVDPMAPIFIADRSRQPTNPNHTHQANVRLTIQASAKHKLLFYGDKLERLQAGANGLGSDRAWEATTRSYTKGVGLYQASWNWAATNRLLFEVGETYRPDEFVYERQKLIWDEGSPSGIVDSGLGLTYRAPTTNEGGRQKSTQENGRAAVSYVTGSHNLRIGTQWFTGHRRLAYSAPNNSYYTFRNGVPMSVTLTTYPYDQFENIDLNLGIFAQDQWTYRRATVNAGIRFDYLKMSIPQQTVAATQYAPARSFEAIENVPNWKDVSPRLGIAYDLFGSGRTALKWNLGRFVEGQGAGFPQVINPLAANSTTSRSWGDANRNFIPDCVLTDPLANGECGANNNNNFGLPIVSSRYDPAAIHGWGIRGYNWETMVGVQQQLWSGVAIDASYNRRWFGNLRVTQNVAVTAADYDPFCVTAPADGRLPDGGGYQVCGLHNLKQSAFGRSDTLITLADNVGGQTAAYDGVDLVLNARLPGGFTVNGGTSTGRIRQNFCGIVNGHPNVALSSPSEEGLAAGLLSSSEQYCDVRPPFLTQLKLTAILPRLWKGIETSFALQSAPGPEVVATWAAPASAITNLGRPLSGGASSVSVGLVPAGTIYGDRLNQIDFRLTRTFRLRQYQIQPQLDLYNVLNASPVLTENNTFGPNWQQPVSMLLGRMVKFGLQMRF